nr:hypothetical protein [Tanacetum cinerariifolium]
RLMEADLAPTQPTQVNKVTTSCEICSGPHNTQNFMEDLEQAFVEYASSCTDEAREILELGKNGSVFVQGKVPTKMEDPRLFTLPCRLRDSKPFDTLAGLGSCVNIIPLYIYKKLNIRLLEETEHSFGLADGTKSYPVGIVKDVEVRIGKLKLLNDCYVIDMKKDPKTPLLDKPPKNEDGAWHAKIKLIDPDGEEFTKTLQSIPTTRKLSERESPREIIDLDHFYDT